MSTLISMLNAEQSQALLMEYAGKVAIDDLTKDLSSYEMGVLITLGQYLTDQRTTYIHKSEIESVVISRGLIKPSTLLNTLASKKLIEVNRTTLHVSIPLYSKLYADMLVKIASAGTKRQRRVNVKNVPKDGVLLVSGASQNEDSTVVVTFPLRDGSVALITKDFITEQQAYFPNIQVADQLSRASAWCNSNINRLKEPSGIRKFINSWLTRAASSVDTLNAVMQYQSKSNGFGHGVHSPNSGVNSELSDDFGIATISAQPKSIDTHKKMTLKQ